MDKKNKLLECLPYILTIGLSLVLLMYNLNSDITSGSKIIPSVASFIMLIGSMLVIYKKVFVIKRNGQASDDVSAIGNLKTNIMAAIIIACILLSYYFLIVLFLQVGVFVSIFMYLLAGWLILYRIINGGFVVKDTLKLLFYSIVISGSFYYFVINVVGYYQTRVILF